MQGAPETHVDSRGPILAVVLVGAFIVFSLVSSPAKDGASLPWTINPTGHLNDLTTYLGLYAVTIPAKELLNTILQSIGNYVLRYKRMDEGDGKVKKLEVLEFHDLCYLALNTLVEYLGLNHIVAFLISSAVDYERRNFNVYSGPLAFIAVFLINDIVYYWFHLVAHRRVLYPYCHKQHHRQFLPFRGYADAANQHPLEQTYGFSIFIFSSWITSKLLGLHAATAWLAMLAWALLNICNHLAFDMGVHLPLPYPALPRDHNTHHRFPTTNYSTLTTLMDRLFGTYRAYQPAGQKAGNSGKKEADPADLVITRLEVFPSGWSFFGLGFFLFLSFLAVEIYNLGGALPDYHQMAVFTKSAILIVNLGLVFAALDQGPEKHKEEKPQKSQNDDTFVFKGQVQGEAMPAGFTKRWGSGKGIHEGASSMPVHRPDSGGPIKRTLHKAK